MVGFNRLGLGTTAESCKHGNVCSGCIKTANFLDQLSNCHIERTMFHRVCCLIIAFTQNYESVERTYTLAVKEN